MSNQRMDSKESFNSLAITTGAMETKKFHHFYVELWYLLRIEFKNVRDSWVWSVLMISLFPMITITFLSFFMADATEATIMRIITGNMVFPMVLMGMNTYAIEISLAKHSGHFTFYSSLPVSKINFIFAKFISGFLMTLPSVIVMTFIGQLMFGITLNFSLVIIPISILCIGSCVGFGMLIGFLSPSHQITNIGSQMFMMMVCFLTPIMIPMEQLPKVLQIISYGIPTTYVADSFYILFTSGWQTSIRDNILILLAFLLLFIILVFRHMDWRVER